MHTTVAEDRKVFAQAYFGDFDGGKEIRFLRSIENVGQGYQDCVVMLSIVPKLRNRLRDEHIEPVQRLGLMRVDIVVGLGEDSGGGQAGRRCRSLVAEL